MSETDSAHADDAGWGRSWDRSSATAFGCGTETMPNFPVASFRSASGVGTDQRPARVRLVDCSATRLSFAE